jgi:hypothetical protein
MKGNPIGAGHFKNRAILTCAVASSNVHYGKHLVEELILVGY